MRAHWPRANTEADWTADLSKAPAGSNQGFISPDLSLDPSTKSGYSVSLAADASAGVVQIEAAAATCNASAGAPMSSYWAGAIPTTVGSTGQRSFATGTAGTLYQNNTGVAIANPIPAGTSIVQ